MLCGVWIGKSSSEVMWWIWQCLPCLFSFQFITLSILCHPHTWFLFSYSLSHIFLSVVVFSISHSFLFLVFPPSYCSFLSLVLLAFCFPLPGHILSIVFLEISPYSFSLLLCFSATPLFLHFLLFYCSLYSSNSSNLFLLFIFLAYFWDFVCFDKVFLLGVYM